MNIIEARGLGKCYGGSWALRECTLAIPAGQEGEPSPQGGGGEHRGDDATDQDAGQGADRERGQRPGRERNPRKSKMVGASELVSTRPLARSASRR
jgi:hypothetical protein